MQSIHNAAAEVRVMYRGKYLHLPEVISLLYFRMKNDMEKIVILKYKFIVILLVLNLNISCSQMILNTTETSQEQIPFEEQYIEFSIEEIKSNINPENSSESSVRNEKEQKSKPIEVKRGYPNPF